MSYILCVAGVINLSTLTKKKYIYMAKIGYNIKYFLK